MGGSTTGYMIGNSLTQDSEPVTGLAMIAADSGRYFFPGYYNWGGQSLTEIQATPGGTTITQGGIWTEALPARSRDYMSAQPFEKTGSTLGSDVAAISAFADSYLSGPSGSLTDPKIIIYAAWPGSPIGSNYNGRWLRASPDNLSELTIMSREYFANLYTRVAALYPGKVRLIPIGECIYNVDLAAKAGQIPGVANASDLYRDSLHLGPIGNLIAASTVFSCAFRRLSVASPATVAYYAAMSAGGSEPLTETIAALVQPIVWSTLQADPRTGVV